jgi:hypothetical protein
MNCQQRATWAARGVSGWYIGPALEQYRCYKVYITETGGERIPDMVEFFPTKCNSPALTQTDRITIAATKLTNALTDPPPPASFHNVTNDTMSAIEKLADIFSKMVQPKDTSQSTTAPAPTVTAILPRVTTPDTAPPTLTPPPADTIPLPRVATLPRVTATTPRQPSV